MKKIGAFLFAFIVCVSIDFASFNAAAQESTVICRATEWLNNEYDFKTGRWLGWKNFTPDYLDIVINYDSDGMIIGLFGRVDGSCYFHKQFGRTKNITEYAFNFKCNILDCDGNYIGEDSEINIYFLPYGEGISRLEINLKDFKSVFKNLVKIK